jgi:Zn-dependent protease
MINKNEIFSILLITLILAFTISILKISETFLFVLISVFIIIIANVFAKKIASYYLDSEIEIKLWEIKRYGFQPTRYFKKMFPAGAFFPILITAFSLGYLKWMACLVFDIKPKIYKAAKRHGLYSFSEMAECHIGLIAGSGIFINLILAIIGYLIGFDEFAKLNIYYAFFNILPISDLDGNKIFFGSLVLWSFLAAIILIGLSYVFLVI